MSIFDIGKASISNKVIAVPQTETKLYVSVIKGASEGPNVLVTAGIHNEEYCGIETARRLAIILDPKSIKGTVAIIHVANPGGFAVHARDVVPEDGENLNRTFPGNIEGTASHRLAHFITEDFLKPSAFHIDLHSGGGREQLLPHSYFQAMGTAVLKSASKAMAEAVDAEYMVAADTYTGSAFSHAAYYKIPSIIIERGGMALWTETEIEAYLRDVIRVLHRLGVVDSSIPRIAYPKIIEKTMQYKAADSGFWYPANPVGALLNKNDSLGKILNAFSDELSEYKAENKSVLLYQTGSLSVRANESIVTLGILD